MKSIEVKNTSSKKHWDSVIVSVPETMEEAKTKFGSQADLGYWRFLMHALPIELRRCKKESEAQSFVDKLFVTPLKTRIQGGDKKTLLKRVGELGLTEKEVKGLTTTGLQKVIAALEAVNKIQPVK